jgi:hypothetical protein
VISRDGKYLASYQPGFANIPPESGGSGFWNLETFNFISVPGFSDGSVLGPSRDPLFSRNSRWFIFEGTIYDLEAGLSYRIPWGYFGVFTPDSKRFLGFSWEDRTFVFVPLKPDAEPELAFKGLEIGASEFPTGIAASPTGELFAYAKQDGTVAVIKNPFFTVRFGSMVLTTLGAQLQWEGGSGRFRIEAADHIPSLTWEAIVEDTTQTTVSIPTGGTARFFRIKSLGSE